MGKRLIIHGANFGGVTFGNYVLTAPVVAVTLDAETPTESITITSSRIRTVDGTARPAEYCPLSIVQAPQGIAASVTPLSGTTTAQLLLQWDGTTELTNEPVVLSQTGGNTLTIHVTTEVDQQQETVTTYGDFAFSTPQLNLSIAPGSSTTIQVTSSRVPTVNGVVQSREFCPFTIAAQGGATCILGSQNGLTKALTITLPANATGSTTVVLTQDGSEAQLTISVTATAVVWEYHISVEDNTVDSGRLALGRSKSIQVTSYRTNDGGVTKQFVPFSIQRGDETSVDVMVAIQAGVVTADVTISMENSINKLGIDTIWTVIQDTSGETASISMFGTPNWVAGYYYSDYVWTTPQTRPTDNNMGKYASFNPMLDAPTDPSVLDFSITIHDYVARVCLVNKRSSNYSGTTIPSLYGCLRDTSWNNKLNTNNTEYWSLNVAKHVNNSGLADTTITFIDGTTTYTEAELKAINDNVVITQVTQSSSE